MGPIAVSVAIRADSSAELGGGHLARCRNLALELRRLGADVRFLTASLTGNTANTLVSSGFAIDWLPAEVQGSVALDARLSIAALQRRRCEWLIVDHYGLARDWEAALQATAQHTLVIDDLADRAHDCDVLLDQNFFVDPAVRYAGLLPDRTLKLLGPRYALLPESFARLHAAAMDHRQGTQVRRLIVSFGSTDTLNLTERVLGEIAPLCQARGLAVEVVLSSAAPHLAAVRRCVAGLGATLHVDSDNMAGLLAGADIAIGAGGTTNWERCAVGIPSIVCAVAANQIQVCQSLAESGLLSYLGWHADIEPGDWVRALQALLDDPGRRLEFSKRSVRCVDGLGAKRVARELLGETSLNLRPARAADCADVLAWRNDPGTRKHALDPAAIDPDAHARWFHAAIDSSDKALLIAEIGAMPVGVLRYDFRSNGEAVISVYLVPAERGGGWGSPLLRAGSTWLRRRRPAIRRVRATILQANSASIATFLRAGYRRQPDGDYLLELAPA